VTEERILVARHGQGYLEKLGDASILHVKGAPYERGFQHGYLLRDVIARTVPRGLTAASAVCGKAVGGSPEDGLERLMLGKDIAKEFLPGEILEEIHGISDALTVSGSTLDFDDVLAWNLMYDTWCFYAHPDFKDPDTIGCSSFSAWGAATADGNLIFGKNMDNLDLPGIPEGRVLVICDPDKGLGHANITQAGMLAIDGGFNEAGICMMTHYSGSAHETMRGQGIGTLSRRILQNARSLDDAIALVSASPRCTGINYHVADASARTAAVVEANARHVGVRRPWHGDALWSTNHCNCYPGWMGYSGLNMVEDQQPVYGLKDISSIDAWQTSLRQRDNPNIAASGRFRQLGKLLEAANGRLDMESGIEILRDRHHPDTGELREWDTPAKARNDGTTISYLLPRKSYSEKIPFYKSSEESPITGQSTNLWSMMIKPGTGEFSVALEGLPAHRYEFRQLNLFTELGRGPAGQPA